MARALLVLLLLACPGLAEATCVSIYDDALNRMPWGAAGDDRYTLCYNSSYQQDVTLAETWIDNAFRIGLNKYGVVPPVQRRGYDLRITIFLVPHTTSRASSHTATVTCCSDSVSVEIHILTPSSPDHARPVDDFIKTLTHEMMNVLHYESREPMWIQTRRRPPRWILEGLAEYEGYYKTTEANRQKVDWLVDYVYRYEQDDIVFGRTLESGEWTIRSMSRYRGGAIIMIYLAERFGEQIHPQLFTATLRQVLLRHYGVERPITVFEDLGDWLGRKYLALSAGVG